MFYATLLSKLLYLWPVGPGRDRMYRSLSEKMKSEMDKLPQPIRMKRSGIKLFVRSNDHLSRWFRYFGSYEWRTCRALRRYANPEKVYLDVGANLGLHAIGVAKDVGCDVVAFEPNPVTADCFEKSIAYNKLDTKIKNFRVALSSEEGTFALVQPSDHAGKAALEAPNPHFREGDRIDVDVKQLDHYDDFHKHLENLDKKVGLVKMDIEGAEERALRGMEEMLKDHRPTIIMELFDGNLFGFISSKTAVISYLESLGYKLVKEFEWNGLFIHKDELSAVK